MSTRHTASTLSTLFLTDINLPGYGGGDQGGPVFLKALDGLLDCGDERIDLGGFAVEEISDSALLGEGWNSSEYRMNVIAIHTRYRRLHCVKQEQRRKVGQHVL